MEEETKKELAALAAAVRRLAVEVGKVRGELEDLRRNAATKAELHSESRRLHAKLSR